MRVTDLTVEAWWRRPSQDNRPMVRRGGASGQRLASTCRRVLIHLCSCHRSADGLTHRDAVGLEAMQAEDVDSEVVGSNALAMKWIDTTGFAEEVASCPRMETILGE